MNEAPPPVYWARPIKRKRRTNEELDQLLTAVHQVLGEYDEQITIRHLFYRLEGLGVIQKTEQAYKLLCSHLTKWRRTGEIEWGAFTDNTRWHLMAETFNGVDDALESAVRTYRRNLWTTQPYYVEVWVEKDAMAGIVSESAKKFGVPVFVCRGFASLSSLNDAAYTFRRATKAGKTAVIYHLGDYDPSGVAAGESVLKAFKDDFNVRLEFVRLAVTRDQIQEMNLPTRPVKDSDLRAKKWTGGDCVELDTMPPAEIKRLVQGCIVQHIDARAWEVLKRTEAMERETLEKIWKEATA